MRTQRFLSRAQARFASNSFLVVRLKPDDRGRLSYARKCLRQSAEKQAFTFRSIYGPTAVEDDVLGVVEIRLKRDPEHDADNAALARTLLAAGWQQFRFTSESGVMADRRVFTQRTTRASRLFAADFVWMHAGEWFSLSGMSQEAISRLRFGANWCYPLQQGTRALPGNGTNEHAKEFHPVRETGAKRKSAARARVRSAQIQRFEQVADGVLAVKDVAKPGFDFDREGNQAKIGFDFEHVAKSWHASWNATPIPLEDKESP